MTMQVNSSSATDNIYGGCSDKTEADAKRQEPVSIFSDKNNNGIVDKKDFDDEATAQLAFEKGLLGRSWDAVKDFIDKLLTTDATENLTKETRYSEIGTEYLAEIDSSGKEVRRTYYKEDGTISKIINMEYDEDGKLVKEIYLDAEGNLDATNIPPIVRHEYAESYERIMFYNKNDEFVSSFVSYTGETPAYNGKNGGKITKSMYDIFNKLVDIDEDGRAFESVLRRIFGDKLKDIYTSRGGSAEISLKDGTTIYMDNHLCSGNGNIITHPDGTVEKYSREGELLE